MFSLRPKIPDSANSEGIAPPKGLRLSRSPHPYHRRASPGRHHGQIGSSQNPSDLKTSQRTQHLTASPLQETVYKGENYGDTDSRARRKSSTSVSDSATEADDESGGVLRRLPAPPLKLRKGIKDYRGSGIWSPLLTPTYLDENEQKFSTGRRHDTLQSSPVADEERSRIQVKFNRRRRAEFLRRISETILLGSVGIIACGRQFELLYRTWWKELLAHGLVLFGTYFLYPLRIICGKSGEDSQGRRFRWRLKIPAAFDPAPLLYPTLIPVFVALSLAAVNPKLLLPNLILSIASIPRQVIPFYGSFFGSGLVQWFLSTIPVAVFDRGTSMLPKHSPTLDLLALDPLSSENLTMLYPLHQALLPSLGYLTTTSLLPAELQLLSVSMINILFLSTSPQALILKALLWIGGLSIFVLCGTVLRSGVALARAIAVKWSYALYVYAAVLFIIAVPIRLFVSHRALQNYEPIGWALGYLLGELPYFTRAVTLLKIGHWIPTPSALAKQQNWDRSIWAEKLHNLGAANVRLLICLYCIGILVIGLRLVFRLTAFVEVDTRRKVFHGMMVVMFLPSILIDPPFAALALILVLAIFLLLDLFRASQLPPLSRPLTHFLAPYVDGRDHRGPVIVSHIFLLIGCAIPLWLSLAAVSRSGAGSWEGWEVPTRDIGMISGVVCVGMGDAAASLIGRRFGRRRWCWSGGKSLEGSLAFAVAVVLGLSAAKLSLQATGWVGEGADHWGATLAKAAIAATGASLTEAVLTGGNDNVIVPVILWLLVRGLEI
ncbi:hypothetical protein MMC07_004614 [Pseudocyphellaria aurata]|nr:hypothetical protein [Pseudocyphellaria aurata]